MAEYKERIKLKYPELYKITRKHVLNDEMWHDFYKDIFEEKDISHTLEDWDNEILLRILEYLSSTNIIEEQEGDAYRELASNLPTDANIFVKNPKQEDEITNSMKNSYKNMTDYLKFCYNEFGDQGYLYFAIFNIKLLKWFMGLKVESDIQNTRGPLRLDFDLPEYLQPLVKFHQKKIIGVLIDVLASGNFHKDDNKKHYRKIIKQCVDKL